MEKSGQIAVDRLVDEEESHSHNFYAILWFEQGPHRLRRIRDRAESLSLFCAGRDEVALYAGLRQQIQAENVSEYSDRFVAMRQYLQLLLIHTRRRFAAEQREGGLRPGNQRLEQFQNGTDSVSAERIAEIYGE